MMQILAKIFLSVVSLVAAALFSLFLVWLFRGFPSTPQEREEWERASAEFEKLCENEMPFGKNFHWFLIALVLLMTVLLSVATTIK